MAGREAGSDSSPRCHSVLKGLIKDFIHFSYNVLLALLMYTILDHCGNDGQRTPFIDHFHSCKKFVHWNLEYFSIWGEMSVSVILESSTHALEKARSNMQHCI